MSCTCQFRRKTRVCREEEESRDPRHYPGGSNLQASHWLIQVLGETACFPAPGSVRYPFGQNLLADDPAATPHPPTHPIFPLAEHLYYKITFSIFLAARTWTCDITLASQMYGISTGGYFERLYRLINCSSLLFDTVTAVCLKLLQPSCNHEEEVLLCDTVIPLLGTYTSGVGTWQQVSACSCAPRDMHRDVYNGPGNDCQSDSIYRKSPNRQH